MTRRNFFNSILTGLGLLIVPEILSITPLKCKDCKYNYLTDYDKTPYLIAYDKTRIKTGLCGRCYRFQNRYGYPFSNSGWAVKTPKDWTESSLRRFGFKKDYKDFDWGRGPFPNKSKLTWK